MPITKSAKKALRSSKRKRVLNIARKSQMKEAIRGAKDAAASKKADAVTSLSAAYQAIDKAVKRGLLKKNTAARKKSRISKLFAKAK